MTDSDRITRSKPSVWPWLAVSLLVLAPSLALVALRATSDQLEGVTLAPEPVLLAVESRLEEDGPPVLIRMRWGPASQLVAPPWVGMVTGLSVQSNQPIRSGDPVVEVDGIGRIGFHSDKPFWRFLQIGDQGEDVVALQSLLSTQALFDGPVDGRFGRATSQAVREFAGRMGIVESDGTFDPGWIVWLSSAEFVVEKVELRIGEPAPEAGAPILLGPQPIVDADVLDGEGVPIDLDHDWELRLSDGSHIVISDSSLDSEAKTQLRDLVEQGVEEKPGSLVRVEPVEVFDVPASAVMTGADGQLCVWAVNGIDYRAQIVELGSSFTGSVPVLTGLKESDQVLVNPSAILQEDACP